MTQIAGSTLEDDLFGSAVISPPHASGRPRVLHVLEAVSGGTLRHVLDLIRTVNGVEHHVAIPPAPTAAQWHASAAHAEPAKEIVNAGAAVHTVNMVRNPMSPMNMRQVWKLRKLIARLQPIAVHGHSAMGGAFARLAAAGRSVPVVYTPHGLATRRPILAAERVLAPLTDRVIAVSESEGARALSLGLTTEERLVIIGNGIDLMPEGDASFNLREFLELPATTTIVGTVARVVAQKAPEDFVRVCAEVHESRPDVHFVLVGSGELQGVLDAAVRSAGLQAHFHQIPYLVRASAAVEQFDVFVLTSQFEGAAYTPLEAMRASVPVVLTNVDGNRDTVQHGVSGLLYPFGAVAGLAGGVLSLLGNARLRDDLVAGARLQLKERFDVHEMGATTEALYMALRPAHV